MLSVELYGSASTFKFDFFFNFWSIFGFFGRGRKFQSYFFARLIASEFFLLPAMDKGLVG